MTVLRAMMKCVAPLNVLSYFSLVCTNYGLLFLKKMITIKIKINPSDALYYSVMYWFSYYEFIYNNKAGRKFLKFFSLLILIDLCIR